MFVYNQQVTDTLTQSPVALAEQNHIPVVGVYETMPDPGLRLPDLDAGRGAGPHGGACSHGVVGPRL